MSLPIISVKNVGKRYRLGITHGGQSFKTLRDVIANSTTNVLKKLTSFPSSNNAGSILKEPVNTSEESNQFWALKDISFCVDPGDAIGIIGQNGAGKTTLLKVLSQITEPTEGEIRIRGRVASLLEVGTGFHPELTGGENIFMNGSILGMKRNEIRAKFDEIVAFAGVEKFIDTPVKRYSSGMYVRLAFAVAAHLEPEILLVDEVLAVGDVEFQKKCLGKMGDVALEGRTVILVSHNMQAIRQLTSRCILIENGKIDYDGDTNACISKYLETSFADLASKKAYPAHVATEERPVCIRCVSLSDGKGTNKSTFSFGEQWNLEMEIESISNNIMLYATAHIKNEYGMYIYHLVSRDTGQDYFYSDSFLKVRMIIQKLLLYPGKYSIDLIVSRADSSLRDLDKIMSAISFEVNQSAGLGVFRELGKGLAVVHEVPKWEIEDKEGKKYHLGNKN